MAHNLNIGQDGIANFIVAENEAWHRLGLTVPECFTWQDAIQARPELNYNVTKHQLTSPITGTLIDAWGIFRDDTQDFLGTVGNVYKTIQIQHSFDFADTLLEQDSGSHYESIGILGKGERFFVSARLPHDFSIGGDKHETRLLISSSHDGSLAYTAKLVLTRVVCQNTLTQALRENGATLRIKHTTSADSKLEQAKSMFTGTIQTVQSIEAKFNELAKRVVNKESMVSTLNRLFKTDVTANNVPTRTQNVIQDILKNYESNDNDAFPEQRGTAFNLFNAVTDWSDHSRSVRATSGKADMSIDALRSESALFGTGEAFKSNALDIILEETMDCNRRESQIFKTIGFADGFEMIKSA